MCHHVHETTPYSHYGSMMHITANDFKRCLKMHNKIIRQCLHRHDGYEVWPSQYPAACALLILIVVYYCVAVRRSRPKGTPSSLPLGVHRMLSTSHSMPRCACPTMLMWWIPQLLIAMVCRWSCCTLTGPSGSSPTTMQALCSIRKTCSVWWRHLPCYTPPTPPPPLSMLTTSTDQGGSSEMLFNGLRVRMGLYTGEPQVEQVFDR